MTVKKVKQTCTGQNVLRICPAHGSDHAYDMGYEKSRQNQVGYIKILEDQLAASKKLEFSKIPEGCGFICHICKPCVAMPLEHRSVHMKEVHQA